MIGSKADQIIVKVTHNEVTQKFPLSQLKFSELQNQTRSRVQNLPEHFDYYYQEDEITLLVDCEEGFQNAVRYFWHELGSQALRFYLASSEPEAIKLINKIDNMRSLYLPQTPQKLPYAHQTLTSASPRAHPQQLQQQQTFLQQTQQSQTITDYVQSESFYTHVDNHVNA